MGYNIFQAHPFSRKFYNFPFNFFLNFIVYLRMYMRVHINHSWYVEVRRCLPGVNSFLLPCASLLLNLCCQAWRQSTVLSDLNGSKFHFSLLLNKILLCMGTSFSLCIHQLMNIWTEPSSCLFYLSILCQYQAGFCCHFPVQLEPRHGDPSKSVQLFRASLDTQASFMNFKTFFFPISRELTWHFYLDCIEFVHCI